MNKITEVSRRNIFDEISLQNINWAGRLNDAQFLNRIFDLSKIPSTDSRYKDAGGDISQHRINNYDWEDDWIFYDHRFKLLYCKDEIFLKFLCETIHPAVRSDMDEVKNLLGLYNKHLMIDGFEILEDTQISGRPVFKGKELSKARKLLQVIKDIDGNKLKIFICYATNDKFAAIDLYERLSNDNFEPWLYEKNILPGQNWSYEIKKAVRESNIVIVLLSNNSVSKVGYVQKEIKQAIDVADEQPEGNIFIIPVKLEDCPTPERLKHLQWINFQEDGAYVRLIRSLKTKT